MSKQVSGGLRVAVIAAIVTCMSCESTRHADRSDDLVVLSKTPAAPIEGIGADRWCSDFGQPGLEQAIATAWEENMEVRAAWTRLAQAEASIRMARSSRLPSADLDAEVGYSNRNFGPIDSAPRLIWTLRGAASYEVDVWGRLGERERAASLEAQAVDLTARALVITLTSQIAEAWFDIIAQQARVRLLEAQLDLSQNTLGVLEVRARRGVASALDLAQQKQNIESIRAEIVTTRGSLQVAKHRLAVLLGKAPDADVGPAAQEQLPDLPPLPGEGISLELMQRRPDVRAAYLRLEAADAQTAAAVADRLPRLQLGLSSGFQGEPLVGVLGQFFWNLAAGLAQPVYQGGRLKAEVARREAAAEEQLYQYAQILLAALQEGFDALTLERTQQERLEHLDAQRAASEQALELATLNYRAGAVDYLRVLTALEAQQQIERQLLTARRQQLTNRIRLCRALGGTWVDTLVPPTPEHSKEK